MKCCTSNKAAQKTVLEQPSTQVGLSKKLAKLGLLVAVLIPRMFTLAAAQQVNQRELFGAAKGAKLADSTTVSRGDHESRVFRDPSSAKQSGLILSRMAYERMPKDSTEPSLRFQMAIDAAFEVHEYWQSLSTEEQIEHITQHVIDSSSLASPLISLSLNEATAAYFALGARNASSKVYRGSVSNNNLYASGQPGFEVKNPLLKNSLELGSTDFSMNADYGFVDPVERWLTIAGNHSIPLSELVSVGGFYFRESIDPMTAIRQKPTTFRTPDDLHEVKNISNIQREIHARTVPALLDFSSEFAQSVKHHTNQTVEEQGFLDPDSFDYHPERP